MKQKSLLLLMMLTVLSLLLVSGPAAAYEPTDPVGSSGSGSAGAQGGLSPTAQSPTGPAVVNSSDAESCVFETEISAPAEGKGLLSSVSFNPETCEILDTKLEEVDPADFQNPDPNNSGSQGQQPPAPALNPNAVAVQNPPARNPCYVQRAFHWIEDPVAIKLTGLESKLDWCDTGVGGTITQHSGKATSIWHTEPSVLDLGPGWIPAGSRAFGAGGGVGQKFVGYGSANAFNYRGIFDPVGKLYFNSHKNIVTGDASAPGAAKCNFATAMKRNPKPLWALKHYCGP